MKIRYYQKIDGWRWLGFLLAMIGAFILSNADVSIISSNITYVAISHKYNFKPIYFISVS